MLRRLVLGLAMHQGLNMLGMRTERDQKYALATTLAQELGKPLLVVGGPWGSKISSQLFGIKAHGCGDYCVDRDPLSCEGCNFVPADIRALPFETGFFGVSFASHILEHLPTVEDCAQAWAELHRVADHVLVCMPPKSSLFAWIVPDHYTWPREVGGGYCSWKSVASWGLAGKGTLLLTVQSIGFNDYGLKKASASFQPATLAADIPMASTTERGRGSKEGPRGSRGVTMSSPVPTLPV